MAMWRLMSSADLQHVSAIAATVHPAFPEDDAVFAERLRLYPQGCQVLQQDDAVVGYVFSHPWYDGAPPPLNSLLHNLPAAPATYYIHDLALTPAARGSSAGKTIVTALAAHARQCGFPSLSLVAVNKSEAFWRRHGFRAIEAGALRDKLASYGADARLMRRALPPVT